MVVPNFSFFCKKKLEWQFWIRQLFESRGTNTLQFNRNALVCIKCCGPQRSVTLIPIWATLKRGRDCKPCANSTSMQDRLGSDLSWMLR